MEFLRQWIGKLGHVKTAHMSCESAGVLREGRGTAPQTFVLPALSCKLVTPELICGKI